MCASDRHILAADLLLAVELAGQLLQGGLDGTTTQTQHLEKTRQSILGNWVSGKGRTHQVEGRLLLDVVVSQGAAVFQLLAGEDQALLIRGDTCRVVSEGASETGPTLLVLDLLLDLLDGVGGLDIKSDCLSRKGFDCKTT